jgi:TM2 domain-containing membrane protein YozV
MNTTDQRRSRPAAVAPGTLTVAVVSSLFVPGVGHMMIGRPGRGATWLAGFVLLALIGALHLLPGIFLMVVSAADTWWIGSRSASGPVRTPGAR